MLGEGQAEHTGTTGHENGYSHFHHPLAGWRSTTIARGERGNRTLTYLEFNTG
tara:strand:- start:2659 stop:2817 length:159 start_codon:yes stop_codon:yes gene_type:complete